MSRILLIEDSEAHTALLLDQLLSVEGDTHSFSRASTLAQGMEVLAKSAFDVLLLDLSLPDGSGIETVERILCDYPQIPVIVAANRGDEETALEAVRRGAQDYLVKGETSPGALARSIRHAIGRNESLQRLRRLNQLAPLMMVQRSRQTLLHFVASAACDAVGARSAIVAMISAEGKMQMEAAACTDGSTLRAGDLTELARRAMGTFAESPCPLRMKAPEAAAWAAWSGLPNLLALPVMLSDTDRGALLVTGKKRGEFLLEDQVILSQVRDMLVMAMMGVQASQEARRRAAEAEQGRNQLAVAQQELQRANEQLETRVRERTGDLAETLAKLQREMDERDQAEQRFSRSEVRYRELAESITDVFFALDGDLRYTYWNRAAEQLTGIAAQQAVGRKFCDVFPQANGTIAEQAYEMSLKTGRPCTFLTESHGGHGDKFFEVDVYPCGDGIAVFAKDITLRRRTELALKDSQEKYRDLVENHHDVLFTLDVKGSITFVSRIAKAFTGYSADELVHRPFACLAHPDHLLMIQNALQALLLGQDRSFEFQLQLKQGGHKRVKVSAKAVRDNGRVTGVHGVLSEVSPSNPPDADGSGSPNEDQSDSLEMDGQQA